MLKSWIVWIVLCACVMQACASDTGPGIWDVKAINKCEQESHKFKFDINLLKINATHDGFNGDIVTNAAFTKEFGVRIEICINVDGNWKQFHVLIRDSLYDFFNNIAEDYVTACFEAAEINPPELPVEKGQYHINDFVYNKRLKEQEFVFGSFKIKSFILQDEEEVGCLEFEVEFKEVDE